ncbi:MAG: flavodoxin-dependent (E)-4-hydroxy-3-methylbut-2-enyl-diphosphate synthase [Candidatus Margulisiibacteriota bacterium]|jgi:(E)-4-hydroxy-3-methylbut-2-enyl-diphosphate synthase
MARRKTKEIKIGKVKIGGNNPIAVQSMTKTKTSDIDATVAQIHALEKAGCQIIRCAVPDKESALALKEIKKQINIPLVADIHFNHEYAIIAADSGVDKLRINPGNIGDINKIKAVVAAAKANKIPIRVGVNSGSLEKDLKTKRGHIPPEALVKSALKNVKILESLKFNNIVVAVKASSVLTTIKAYELLSKKVTYPLHVGITESGISKVGTIRSSVGIGALLLKGIGDTIRVSLTGDPIEEVRAGYEILKSVGLNNRGLTIISCPTCGRTTVDVEKIAEEIYEKTKEITKPLTVAIMGCEVNGPGEAAEADLGLAAGRGVGLIFKKGKIVKKVDESEMVKSLLEEIASLTIK